MNIEKNLFDMTPEEEQLSRALYGGNVIKCLVAPYHTYDQLERYIDEMSPNTYLFPERDRNIPDIVQFVNTISENSVDSEIHIITTNQNIIMDMVGECLRILTDGGTITNPECRPFLANIHDIRHYIMENKKHSSRANLNSRSNLIINGLMNSIRDSQGSEITKNEYDFLKSRVQLIGDDLVRGIIGRDLERLRVVMPDEDRIQSLQEEIERLKKLKG
jgi:hypothetical protein